MSALVFHVTGTPAPQGSKRGFVVNGRAVVVDDSKRTRPWREDVKQAATDALARNPVALDSGPVIVKIIFFLTRPRAHYGTGRNASRLKASAPTWVATRPDIDKLTRSTLDALTAAGVYRDDGQVAGLFVRKVYATGPEVPGAKIVVGRAW